MAVALILAADMEENVVVGGEAVAQHICDHWRTVLQTASVIMDSYYLDVFLNLYLSKEGLLSSHILLRHCPALHSDDYTHLDMQAAQCNGPFCVEQQNSCSYS